MRRVRSPLAWLWLVEQVWLVGLLLAGSVQLQLAGLDLHPQQHTGRYRQATGRCVSGP